MGNLANTNKGIGAEELYLQSFDKYRMALEVNPDYHEAYNNWGNMLGMLAKIKEGKEAEKLYLESFDKYQKSFDLGGRGYNLACWHALRNQKIEALQYLELSLANKEVSVQYMERDEDWKEFLQEPDCIKLLNQFRKIIEP